MAITKSIKSSEIPQAILELVVIADEAEQDLPVDSNGKQIDKVKYTIEDGLLTVSIKFPVETKLINGNVITKATNYLLDISLSVSDSEIPTETIPSYFDMSSTQWLELTPSEYLALV